MLVVEPPAARYESTDGATARSAYEEHLLERVSALENHLVRLSGRLEQTLNLLLRQSENTYRNHALIDALISTLNEAGAIKARELDRKWRARLFCEDKIERDERDETLRAAILAHDQGEEPQRFAADVTEGFDFLRAQESARGIRRLERAAAFAPRNEPLHHFLGEHFFRAGRMILARDYLQRALAVKPNDGRLKLLLGIACLDEGDSASAKNFLSEVVESLNKSFAAHYALGMLLALEECWVAALAHFKQALRGRPSPEAHYVLGSIYYQLKRDTLASRHLRKAVEMDEHYAQAFYLLGLVWWRAGEEKNARQAFKHARNVGMSELRLGARGKLHSCQAPRVAPLFDRADGARNGKGFLTSGDRRLADFLRADALDANKAIDVGRRERALTRTRRRL